MAQGHRGRNSTEAARVELLVGDGLGRATRVVVSLLPGLQLHLRVVEAVGLSLEHDDLVVALLARVLRVVRDSAFRGDLARSLRRVQLSVVNVAAPSATAVVLMLVVVVEPRPGSIVASFAGVALRRVPLRGLPLREAARDAAGAEVGPVWQVLEALGQCLRVVPALSRIVTGGATHVNGGAALLCLRGSDRLLLSVRRAHAKRSISLIRRVPSSVAVILFPRVRVRVHDGVLVEHLVVRLILRETLEVGDLVLDL